MAGINDAAVEAWNLMGATIDWNALETVAVLVGVEDEFERWIHALVTLRALRSRSATSETP